MQILKEPLYSVGSNIGEPLYLVLRWLRQRKQSFQTKVVNLFLEELILNITRVHRHVPLTQKGYWQIFVDVDQTREISEKTLWAHISNTSYLLKEGRLGLEKQLLNTRDGLMYAKKRLFDSKEFVV